MAFDLRRYRREWNRKNRGRYAAQEKAWRLRNRVRLDRARLRRNLWKLYGITLEDYWRRLRKQRRRCAICKRHQRSFRRRFAVDHDHRTGRIRRLLCGVCNAGLGAFKDDPALLRRAARYIEEHRS